jgi:hypothetical protein
MELAVITLLALACSTAISRKLPIDGMLPRVVHSAQFNPDENRPRPGQEPARPSRLHAG